MKEGIRDTFKKLTDLLNKKNMIENMILNMITGVRLTYHLTRPVMHYRNLFFIVFRVNDAVYPKK